MMLHLRFLRSAEHGPATPHWPVRQARMFGVEVLFTLLPSHRSISFLALPRKTWLNAVLDVENVFHGGEALLV